MVTRAQFAHAVGAEAKWIENSVRLLRRAIRYTPAESRLWGLVRVLSQDMGIPLARAAELASQALRHPEDSREVRLGENASCCAAVVVDLARYHSAHAAALSAALELGGARRRGRRRAVSNAAWYGVDLSLLREGLRRSPADRLDGLEENAAFIAAMRNSTRKGLRVRDR